MTAGSRVCFPHAVARRRHLAACSRDLVPVFRGPARPSGGRGSPWSDRLEVCLGIAPSRPRLRQHRAERVQVPPDQGRRRAGAARRGAEACTGAEPAVGRRAAADRPTHVLAAVRALNRLECVIETMRHALESLAVVAPDWLLAHAQPDWAERYGHRAMDNRLAKNAARREERARIVAQDGRALLAAAHDPAAPSWLRQVPAVEILRCVWVQQFYLSAEGVQWRTAEHGIPPSALFVSSPYDTDAHLGRKRTTKWVGYKAHLTETCD